MMLNSQKSYKEQVLKKREEVQKFRYWILVLTCLTATGDYYCLDIPAVLKEQIIQQQMMKHTYQVAELYYSLLYTVYNLPNMFLPLLGGYFTDRFGDRAMTIIFTTLVMIGQAIVFFGQIADNFHIMIFGRFVFGIGGESLNITVTTILIRWFQGDELSLSQSIFLSSARCCSILNAFVTPQLSLHYGIIASQYFGLLLTIFSLISSIFLVYFDSKLGINNNSDEEEQFLSLSSILKNVNKLQRLFWITTLVTLLLYICVVTFNSFLSGIIVQDWMTSNNSLERNQEIAAKLMSILFIISTIFLPVVGLVVDKLGLRIRLLQVSALLLCIAFSLMLFKYLLIPLVLIGFGYALFGAIVWPIVAYLVPRHLLGTGMGILTSIQNLGLAFAPLIVTYIKTQFNTNYSIICFFLIVSIFTLFFTYYMKLLDQKREVSLDSNNQESIINCLEKEQYQLRSEVTSINNQNKIHDDEESIMLDEQQQEQQQK